MSGFIATLRKSSFEEIPNLEHISLGPTLHNSKILSGVKIERFTNPKFIEDKVFESDTEFLVLIEGAILNFTKLVEQYSGKSKFEAIKAMYQQHGYKFCHLLRGEFAGAIYDKSTDKWLFFTNHTAAQPLFYYNDQDLFICASEPQMITQVLRKLNRSLSIDSVGAYCLLTFGYMLEDFTVIENIKKLRPGCCIQIEKGKLEILTYHEFQNKNKVQNTKQEIIQQLEDLFDNAISLEYEKDREYGYRHIATLSGGLDSRMSIMCAKEAGFNDILNINWCQNKYFDEQTAREIASDINEGFLFYALDSGNYLTNTIHNAVIANGGLVLYSGSAHLLSCVKTINFQQFGLLHTGMLGDAVMGSFIHDMELKPPEPLSGTYSTMLGDRILPVARKIIANYESDEMFKLYNRAFNGALNGNWTTHQFTEAGSPFLDVDFCEYCFSIPTEMRYKEKIYIDWILEKHRNFAKYSWTGTKARLTDSKLTAMLKRYAWIAQVILLRRTNLRSMNPFEHWIKTNPRLKTYLNEYFRQNISVLNGYKELQKDTIMLFENGNLLEKTQAMTLLEAVKLHFNL